MQVETFSTLQEASGAVHDRAQFLAGGTILMRAVTYGDQSFDTIVRAQQVDRSIGSDAGGLRIGAGATMADVLASRDVDFLHPVARAIGGPQVRNMGTVGGNIFARNPYGDFAVALLALDAQAVMADGRTMPLGDLLATRERPGGLVQAVTIARPESGTFRFRKVSRVKPKGVSVMSIAAHLKRGDPRVVFGNMAPTPTRSVGAERALANGTDAGAIAAACSACLEGLAPADDPLATEWYRREVAPVHLKRLLEEGARY
ncbi:FAD binding domain-containing protein [Rhodobacteraceae bacterium]|nr:FAD binding domain-containing protein [Paracoccaceae bacterium]